MRVLVIEDSREVVDAISLCFQIRWPEATTDMADEGALGIETLKSNSFDLVILDINLPDMDGFETLRQIRTFSDVPVIIVTVRGEEDDKARGLEMGADDYIVKPFAPRDLVARVYAVLRRSDASRFAEGEALIVRGKLKLDIATGEAYLVDKRIKLTPTECRLLYLLMRNAGQTVGGKELSEKLWEVEGTATELLRTYIRRVRDKLNDNPPQILLTERGEGYRFVSPT